MNKPYIVTYTIYTRHAGPIIDFISSYLENCSVCDDFYITYRKED